MSDVPFVLAPEVAPLRGYLESKQWLEPGEQLLEATVAGEGNMNCTVRVRTDRRSFIVKQSRPYVVKYPDIPAPVERLRVEARFYEIVGKVPALARFMPALLAFDGDQYVALIEDLGAAADLTSLYAPGTRIQDDDLASLLEYAELLHALELDPMLRDELSNASMRELNHEHIFVLPLDAANGLDLDAQTPGLAAVAGELQKDARYCARVRELGQHYRADNPSGSLLHGDFYPGSVLATKRGIRVIDPEFAFPGPPEFDLGVLAAHLIFAGEPESAIDRIEAGVARPLDRALLRGFAGAELMRRLLGVAQLPLAPDTDLDQKRQWLALSCRWVAGS